MEDAEECGCLKAHRPEAKAERVESIVCSSRSPRNTCKEIVRKILM
jgi:hypothetical protein